MPTEHKSKVIANTAKRFKESSGVYFTNYTGMNVSQATDLRKKFRENGVEYVVTKS